MDIGINDGLCEIDKIDKNKAENDDVGDIGHNGFNQNDVEMEAMDDTLNETQKLYNDLFGIASNANILPMIPTSNDDITGYVVYIYIFICSYICYTIYILYYVYTAERESVPPMIHLQCMLIYKLCVIYIYYYTCNIYE